jgi:hypothetical protein
MSTSDTDMKPYEVGQYVWCVVQRHYRDVNQKTVIARVATVPEWLSSRGPHVYTVIEQGRGQVHTVSHSDINGPVSGPDLAAHMSLVKWLLCDLLPVCLGLGLALYLIIIIRSMSS